MERDNLLGSTFGRYRVERRLGAGGMGVVYAAADLKLGRTVALKVLSPDLTASPQMLARFQREVDTLARLDAAHIIGIVDRGELDGTPYLATQYVGGGDLGALLRERGPMPTAMAAQVCAQVAEALAAAHRAGVVHRDVKPANVLLRDPAARPLHAYLCDFGIARMEGLHLTTAGAVSGTWTYLAPERMDGNPGSPASDLYSVGCLFFACLTGRAPYAGSDLEVAYAHRESPIPQFAPHGSTAPRVNMILAQALAKDPAQRHAGAEELARDLRALADGRPDELDPGTVHYPEVAMPALRRRRRRKGLVIATATLLVAGLTGGAIWATGRSGDDPGPRAGSPGAGTGADPGSDADQAVTGDVDGDGMGDVSAMVERSRTEANRMIWTSDGKQLEEQPNPINGTPFERYVAGDFDGDGTVEHASVTEISGTAEIIDAEGNREKHDLELPPPPSGEEFLSADATAAGDFDGDGRTDLAMALPVEQKTAPDPFSGEGMSRGCNIWVLLSEGDGFAAAERWFDGIPCFTPDLAVADLGSDGRDDLVWLIDDNSQWQGTVAQHDRLVPLVSDGSLFELGDPVQVPRSNPGGVIRLAAGDVDGDGDDEVVVATQITRQKGEYGLDYQILESEGTTLGSMTSWHRTNRYGYELTDSILTVSDVDGDGRDDVVNATALGDVTTPEDEGVRPGQDVNLDVLISGSDGFEAPAQWAVCRDCSESFAFFGRVADRVQGD